MARKIKQPARIRLFLVDQEPYVRKGLELLLSGRPDLEVCGHAENSRNAMRLIQQLEPDLAIVDFENSHGTDSLTFLRRLHKIRPKLKVLVFSMHDQSSYVRRAFDAGAQGYVAKGEGADKLLEAIHTLLAGKCHFPLAVAAHLSEWQSGCKRGQIYLRSRRT